MTRKLEELLGLPMNDDGDVEIPAETKTTMDTYQEDVVEITEQMTSAEKIDFALTTVTGFDEHDREMDAIAEKAMKAYQEIFNLGMSCTEQNAGKVLDSAANMLKTALEARDAKVAKKLKMIDLMIKKHKIEKDSAPPETDPDVGAGGRMYDRNELLRVMREASIDVKPKENDK